MRQFLREKGCDIKLKKRLKKFDVLDNYVSTMYFDDIKIKIKREDLVIMAVPPSNLKKLFPSIEVPTEYNSIVNVHFNMPKNLNERFSKKIIGFINTNSHWLFFSKRTICP